MSDEPTPEEIGKDASEEWWRTGRELSDLPGIPKERLASIIADRVAPLAIELDGYRKDYALLQKGMESQAELMDNLKQSERTARALAARLAERLAEIAGLTQSQTAARIAREALADARSAGLAGEGER